MHTCLNTSLVRCSYSYISSQCSIDSMDICRETPPAEWCTIVVAWEELRIIGNAAGGRRGQNRTQYAAEHCLNTV